MTKLTFTLHCYKPCLNLPIACHLSWWHFYRELRLKMFIKCSVWHSNPPQLNAEKNDLICLNYCHTVMCYCHTVGLKTALRFFLILLIILAKSAQRKLHLSVSTELNLENQEKSQYIWHHSKYPNLVTSWTAFSFLIRLSSQRLNASISDY